MSELFHYSPLMHLPAILRSGLARGEITRPGQRTEGEVAIGLTTQTDPDRIHCWGSAAAPLKTTVRYVCRLPDGDTRLEPCRQAWQRLAVPKRWREHLDPQGESKWWYFWHGTIPLDLCDVQLRGKDGYVTVVPPALSRLGEIVAAEVAKFEFVRPPEAPHDLYFLPRNPLDQDSWLVNAVYPADTLLRPGFSGTGWITVAAT